MKKKIFLLVRRCLFLCVLSAALVYISSVFVTHAGTDWTASSTYGDFYQLKPNTVDVLFFGSSHVARAFAPQELYNEHGLTSYNLAGDEQSIQLSYFWLEEALRTQSPQVVVLDSCFLFDYHPGQPMSVGEGSYRKALDPMRMSPVKMRAIHEICRTDPDQSELSYYLPFIRYHSGWQELNTSSFQLQHKTGLMGYTPNFLVWNSTGEEPFLADDGDEAEMLPLMKAYLDRIRELCSQKGITLLLVKTPSPWQTPEQHNAVLSYAEEYGLDYIDFNEDEAYYGADYWYATDSSDIEHANHWGAMKLTYYLGDYMISEYGLEPHEDMQWDESDALYQLQIEEGEASAS